MTTLESLRLGFAFTLGTATFFAPCALPLLPGYVAFYVGRESDDVEGPITTRLSRALVVALVTSLGFFVVFALLFGIVFAVGSQVLGDIALLELGVGLLLIVLGVAMALGKLDEVVRIQLPERRRGPVGYFLFGVLYAVAAAGCTAPLFIGVASLGLSGGPGTAIATFSAYAAGMAVLMIGITLAAALGRDALVSRLVANTGLVTRLAGVVLVLAGIAQLYWFLFVFDGLRYFA